MKKKNYIKIKFQNEKKIYKIERKLYSKSYSKVKLKENGKEISYTHTLDFMKKINKKKFLWFFNGKVWYFRKNEIYLMNF